MLLRKKFARWISQFILLIIKGYQRFVSPLMTPSCRFYPSCSEYAKQAFNCYGPLIAIRLIFFRLIRCNPCCKGGCDFVPLPPNRQRNS